MTGELITLDCNGEIHRGVVVIRPMNSPVNVLSSAVAAELVQAISTAAGAPPVRAIVIYGPDEQTGIQSFLDNGPGKAVFNGTRAQEATLCTSL
jgi:hypothetical protein